MTIMKHKKRAQILIVDDDAGHLTTLKTIVKSWGFRVETADDGSQAVDRVEDQPFDLILMDVKMTEMDGIEALKLIKRYNPAIPIIIMTAFSSVESAVEALKSGAYDYLTKPLDFEALKMTLERAIEHVALRKENKILREKLRTDFDINNIIGKSPVMKAFIDTLITIAPTEATVLISGESGTGKELVARSIHFNSERKHHPLVVINCAALTETLLESELFGHEKGAFTGADRKRHGRFKQADKGTIFLDEIGETSSAMQAKLLRVIQEREFERVGGEQTIEVDVRIIAATNRNLMEEVQAGRFREDLYYRLNVVSLEVPPLRNRQDDIPLLTQYFLDRYTEKNRKPIKGWTPRAMDILVKHQWPGNVRELENAVERAVILATGDYISEKELPLSILPDDFIAQPKPAPPIPPAHTRPLEEVEKETILAALAACHGNKSEAARQLGITRKTLHNKLKLYGHN
jgi:two-component system response regulator HydG